MRKFLAMLAVTFCLAVGMFAQSYPYSAGSQQSIAYQYYRNSLATMPLPVSVKSGLHDDPNSANMMHNMFVVGRTYGASVVTNLNTQNTASAMQNWYYAGTADPIYKIASCSHVNGNSTYSPLGKYFHIPNAAQPSGTVPGSTSGDSSLNIWDESTDIDAVVGGRILALYNVHVNLPSCSCHTTVCANSTGSCQLTSGGQNLEYCGLGFPERDTQVVGVDPGGYNSLGFAPGAGFVRDAEIMAGVANHVIILNTGCTTNPASYPATGQVLICGGTGDDANHLHKGSLLYIDAGYNCSAQPQWVQAVCKAMQNYGGYISDTGGQYNGGLSTARIEDGQAWAQAGITWPFLSYLQSFGTGNSNLVQRTGGANMQFFDAMSATGLQGHLHVADKCVALGLNSQAGGCVPAGSSTPPAGSPPPPPPPPPPAPTGADYYVTLSSLGSDSNDGSQAHPWKTLQHAILSFVLNSSGTTIHVAGGNYFYTGGQNCYQGEGPSVCISRAGTSSTARLILQCDEAWTVPSSSAGCHIFSTSGTIFASGLANHITIRGFDLSGSDAVQAFVSACDGNNPTLAKGVCPAGNDIILEQNYFHDIGQTGGGGCASSGAVTTLLSHGAAAHHSPEMVIRNNRFQHIGDLAQARKNGGSCNQYHAVYISGAVQVYNNLFLDVVSFSIHDYAAGCGGVIANNTVVRDGASGIVVEGFDCGAAGFLAGFNDVINNISIDNGQFGLSASQCTNSSPSLVSNDIFGPNPSGSNPTFDSCSTPVNITSASGASLFVGYLGSASTANGNDDLHLKVGSPAINAGIKQCINGGPLPCYPPLDFDKNTRPNMDIGAYSFGGVGGSPPPNSNVPPPPTGLTVTVH